MHRITKPQSGARERRNWAVPIGRRTLRERRLRRYGFVALALLVTIIVAHMFLSSVFTWSDDSGPSVQDAVIPTPSALNGTAAGVPLTAAPDTVTTSTQRPAGRPYKNPLDPVDVRTAAPEPDRTDLFNQREEGEFEPEEPQRVPGLRVHRRKYTPAELLALYGDSLFVYSFVNGSEVNHYYRKRHVLGCRARLMSAEADFYAKIAALDRTRAEEQDAGEGGPGHAAGGDADLLRKTVFSPPPLSCKLAFLREPTARTGGGLLSVLRRGAQPSNSDRETDELRHSLRSIEKHIQWHRGRVVVVSPGHHPLWMDNARTFLAGSCGGPAVAALRERGTHVRVTTVHQDAVMPYGMKLTVNSHTIEHHLWRVLNNTPVHVYWNDDYFVNRDVAITDLFNEHGGTIVRTEGGTLGAGKVGGRGASWQEGARHTNLFNILELDEAREDALPADLTKIWRATRNFTGGDPREPSSAKKRLPPPQLTDVVDTGYLHQAPALPAVERPNVMKRRFATHAPFVYCTNMFSFIATRYEREYALNTLTHRGRKARDLFVPFVYNAFIMARPWQASPQFLPYLLQLHAHRASPAAAAPPTADIVLNNMDGCGPASMLVGEESGCEFGKFLDDLEYNKKVMATISEANPLYFNINAGFKSPEASQQLLSFLHGKFPDAVYLERGYPAVSAEDAALPGLYAALMRLPVVAVTSFAEGVCPLLRSLQLALPDHAGVVVPVVARDGRGGDADATLAELRAELRHRVRSAMPVVGCAYSERVVRPGAATAAANAGAGAAGWGGGALAGVVAAALGELGAEDAAGGGGVTLPAVCGGAGGGVRIVGIVVDGRSDARGGVRDARWLRRAVTMPGQTLALEDFEVVPVGGDGGGSVLVLSRASAAARAVHWIDGAAESDLLATYPIPHAAYEDLKAPLQWGVGAA